MPPESNASIITGGPVLYTGDWELYARMIPRSKQVGFYEPLSAPGLYPEVFRVEFETPETQERCFVCPAGRGTAGEQLAVGKGEPGFNFRLEIGDGKVSCTPDYFPGEGEKLGFKGMLLSVTGRKERRFFKVMARESFPDGVVLIPLQVDKKNEENNVTGVIIVGRSNFENEATQKFLQERLRFGITNKQVLFR